MTFNTAIRLKLYWMQATRKLKSLKLSAFKNQPSPDGLFHNVAIRGNMPTNIARIWPRKNSSLNYSAATEEFRAESR